MLSASSVISNVSRMGTSRRKSMQTAATRAATMLTQNVDAIAIENDSCTAWTIPPRSGWTNAC